MKRKKKLANLLTTQFLCFWLHFHSQKSTEITISVYRRAFWIRDSSAWIEMHMKIFLVESNLFFVFASPSCVVLFFRLACLILISNYVNLKYKTVSCTLAFHGKKENRKTHYDNIVNVNWMSPISVNNNCVYYYAHQRICTRSV